MKRIYFILALLCVCAFVSAQSKKVETFDKNTWHWTENSDEYQYVNIEDGFLVIQNLKKNKKATKYQQIAKAYAKVPLRPQENFKLTIKYLVASYYGTFHYILFNTGLQCFEDDEGTFNSYFLAIGGGAWGLNIGDSQKHTGKLPGKQKVKGECPMEFVLEKKSRITTIEINGIQIYEGALPMTTPCIGFWVPLWSKKFSCIKIDEIIIEQADSDDD